MIFHPLILHQICNNPYVIYQLIYAFNLSEIHAAFRKNAFTVVD
jgi:hypothetical protein